MIRFLIAAIASMFAGAFAAAQSASDKAVVRLDPALDALVSADAKVETVKSGFGFTEGPVWVQKGKEGYLLFTDIPGNVIWKLTPEGKASGLDQNSLVSGLFLATIFGDRIDRVIGKLSPALMQKVNACLKVTLELP